MARAMVVAGGSPGGSSADGASGLAGLQRRGGLAGIQEPVAVIAAWAARRCWSLLRS